ncbi:lipase 1-like [Leguminivora glycinivorella]|uniref:lipase 1-like n=1 Tax=Leguminivora glycinivorella TaxID=1035111 RepID=UPI00200D2E88|nr:lipase 1-like [Leguminivora glycinivorella]
MIILQVTIFLVIWTSKCAAGPNILDKIIPEDALLNFTDLSKKYGHTAEEHNVVTEDGYILKLFHIPGESKKPIFIMHGLGDSADSYVLRGHKSLAVTLANAGYDVWLGNNRGNKYSRRHSNLNPDKDNKFWQFSFHEIGIYDLPAMIDFVLGKTKSDKVDVIAHSQGTTAFFALLATKTVYNDKINVLAALGPVAFLGNLSPPISTIAITGPVINQVLINMNVEEIAANETAARELQTRLCSLGFIGGNFCRFGLIFPLFGFDPEGLEAEFAPIALAHFPAGLSRKSLVHYDQLFYSKRFSSFDFGPSMNLKIYKSFGPPDYDLNKVTTRIALYLGRNDPFAKIKDAELLKEILPNVVEFKIIDSNKWTHVDFAWANDMDKYLFPLIFDILKKFD